MKPVINGIQQAGIGVPDAEKAKLHYKNLFGMNVKVFDDKAPAALMTQYTGNEVHHRHAILSMNLAGGGGLEIWQYTSRKPVASAHHISPGDPGIFAIKIKCRNMKVAYRYFEEIGCTALSPLYIAADNRYHFWVKDFFGNWFMLTEGNDWFKHSRAHCGGVLGAVIGVSDMENALHFYRDVMGIDEEVYNITGKAADMPGHFDKAENFHRVLLRKKPSTSGAFSKLLGGIEIELLQPLDRAAGNHIFHNRYWGDCGFIHLCFDVTDMKALKQRVEDAGYPFTVDSNSSFSMENAAGRFCYVEDPDGTLIELVETHKVPVLKKIGWYLDLKKRKSNKPLPAWMINMLALSKIK
jgi:catechol 2,3-dioxygenase-like lactoylglutathione lyase family enzyme